VARFAIFTSLETPHGRAGLLFATARTLRDRGHRVELVLARRSDTVRAAVPEGVRVVELFSRAAPRLWQRKRPVYLTVGALARYLRRTRPDALLGGSIPPNIVALLARRLAGVGTPVALRQSNVQRIPGDPAYAGIAPRRRDWLVRQFYREADAVIAVAAGTADNVVKAAGVPPERVHVVPAGIDPEVARARAAEPVAHPWFQGDGPPVLVNVGRQVPKKDQATLLHAFARLRAERDCRLVILGARAGAAAELDTLVGRLGLEGSVDRPGSVANPFAYLARADLFVLSSISEGMPNALLEAMAVGCPVVSTDCPSGPSELLDGGRLAPLVPVGDVEALAAALRGALDEPPDGAALAAQAGEFSVTHSAAAYAEVLLALAGERAAETAAPTPAPAPEEVP